jgi:hypothetical protein
MDEALEALKHLPLMARFGRRVVQDDAPVSEPAATPLSSSQKAALADQAGLV